MGTLYMIVGLPSSGKSTFIKNNLRDLVGDEKIHSSDALRLEMFGKLEQTENNKLFTELHKRIKRDLKDGYDVVYDACNISRKRRTQFLKEIKNIDCTKTCCLMATPYKLCLEQDGKRDEFKKVGEHVIKRMYLSFEVPQKTEGFDDVQIYYHERCMEYVDKIDILFSRLDVLDQETPYHSLTVGEHCKTTTNILCDLITRLVKAGQYLECYHDLTMLKVASYLHDIGKEFTKTYNEDKGHYTYYQHHLVGAYDSLFVSKDGFKIRDEDVLQIAKYIQWHMQPFFAKTNKAIRRFKDAVGEDDYEMIQLLHEADKLAK